MQLSWPSIGRRSRPRNVNRMGLPPAPVRPRPVAEARNLA
jgi:hypothetical protein